MNIKLALLAFLTGVLAAPKVAKSETFHLVAAKSHFVAHLRKAGLASGFAHNHVIRARDMKGIITVDPKHLESLHLSVDVDARSLDVDPPALRRAYGLKGALSDSDRRKIAKHMHAKDQLDTARYHTISFVSTATRKLGGDRYLLWGKLTIRGITRDVKLKVKAQASGTWIRGSGSLRVKQSAFGYKPYSAGLGLVKLRDTLTLDLYLAARLRP